MHNKRFKIKRLIPIGIMGVLALLLSSCGTYNSGYEQTDGIYASGNATTVETEENTEVDPYERSNYYKQYFQSKANAYSDLPDEGAIFTDIEAYSTSERLDEEGNIIIEENNYNDGYGPWGSNDGDVTVNIYNYGGYGYGFYYRPFWHSSYWYGWGYPYYHYGPYWSMSYGWGYPFYGYGYYGYPYYGYGYGYGYPYYSYGYPYNYPYNYGISYNRGRRNTDYYRSGDRGRSNISTNNRSSYSRSENTRRINRNDVNANTTRSTRNSTIRNNNNTRTERSNTNRVIRNTRSNTNRNSTINSPTRNNTTRSTRNSNYSTPRRSSNSGTIRSGGSSGRSSGGTMRSGGRGGRG